MRADVAASPVSALQERDVCFISAHDAQSGIEVWRTATIARPGEPGGESWGDLPLVFRAGSDAWIPGSYDPTTNLIYWGTSQAKPWTRFARGTDGDALYTNCTLAIDPATGKIVWHYQHIPGETHDFDEAFERILVDFNGRSSVFLKGNWNPVGARSPQRRFVSARPALPERARRRSEDRKATYGRTCCRRRAFRSSSSGASGIKPAP